MPPRGYRKKQPLTVDDYASSLKLCEAAANILAEVARKHDDYPCLLAALTFTAQAIDKLSQERAALADPRRADPVIPPSRDVDRPEEGRS